MEKLDKRIEKINKANDKKKRPLMTMAERAVEDNARERDSRIMTYLRSTPEEREQQKHLEHYYKKYLELDAPDKVGMAYKEKKSNGIVDTVVYTELGPIIKSETKEGTRYEGYCCTEDFNRGVKHYYYARVCYGPMSDSRRSTMVVSGSFRGDNGVFHDINSVRANEIHLNAMQSLMNRFEAAMQEVQFMADNTYEPVK